MTLKEIIPAELLEFLETILPRESDAVVAQYVSECNAEGSDPIVEAIRFNNPNASKYEFSYVVFEQLVNGKIDVMYGTPRSDCNYKWTSATDLIKQLVKSHYVASEDTKHLKFTEPTPAITATKVSMDFD